MIDQLKNVTDLAKFLILLFVYTGYMTWWASGVSHEIEYNSEKIDAHVLADNMITKDTIRLANQVQTLVVQQEKNNTILQENIEQHSKCTAIMEILLKRVETLESEKKTWKGNRQW